MIIHLLCSLCSNLMHGRPRLRPTVTRRGLGMCVGTGSGVNVPPRCLQSFTASGALSLHWHFGCGNWIFLWCGGRSCAGRFTSVSGLHPLDTRSSPSHDLYLETKKSPDIGHTSPGGSWEPLVSGYFSKNTWTVEDPTPAPELQGGEHALPQKDRWEHSDGVIPDFLNKKHLSSVLGDESSHPQSSLMLKISFTGTLFIPTRLPCDRCGRQVRQANSHPYPTWRERTKGGRTTIPWILKRVLQLLWGGTYIHIAQLDREDLEENP